MSQTCASYKVQLDQAQLANQEMAKVRAQHSIATQHISQLNKTVQAQNKHRNDLQTHIDSLNGQLNQARHRPAQDNCEDDPVQVIANL